jgi:hypothetical protein
MLPTLTQQNPAYHHHLHISVMELGHLLARSSLTFPEVSSTVCHDSFSQLGSSVSLPWVMLTVLSQEIPRPSWKLSAD